MTATLSTRAVLPHRLIGLIGIALVTVVALTLSMLVGSLSTTPGQVLHYVLNPDATDPLSRAVWQSRVPRTVLIVVAGAALGVAGGLMQAVRGIR